MALDLFDDKWHEDDQRLHVLDLPQLYTKPAPGQLVEALDLLAIGPSAFGANAASKCRVRPEGVPDYLTRIVSSSLSWISSDLTKNSIWELASERLSERAGRTAMGSIDRVFMIPTGIPEGHELELSIHEPTLTGDNLGWKTWGSSYAMATRLLSLSSHFPQVLLDAPSGRPCVLELGAGTGVLGMAFAAVFQTHVLMTDLPGIVSNLQKNAEKNAAAVMRRTGGKVSVGALDWSSPMSIWTSGSDDGCPATVLEEYSGALFDTIIVADPIYSSEHPRLLTDVIKMRLSPVQHARVLIGYPLRDEYQPQIDELNELLSSKCALRCTYEERMKSLEDWKEGDEISVEYRIYAR